MSQFDEDAHISAILQEIGNGNRILADIGARLQGSNSAALLRDGWSGTLVDCDPKAVAELKQAFPHCKVICERATPDNINRLVPGDAHLLSIDVDSCDWWLWANLLRRPALVVIETNPLPCIHVAALGTSASYGCSVDAAVMLGNAKGYDYLGRNVVNAFFCRRDLRCAYRLPQVKGHAGSPCSLQDNVFA